MSVIWMNHEFLASEGHRLRPRFLPLATGVTVQYVIQGEPLEPRCLPLGQHRRPPY